ncbi:MULTISPECIES: hypothetical protein [unclassified Psychrobacter]|uniref:hypothetical protein n=1 Tax=unclassified Psychrobacter TaxID=196806 RepID=UPI00071E9A89|nr:MULTISPECIES: hypothetical protein [unclassified Psychrobacter]OLF39152.1 hypothetical protein BTV98_01705 [Psychrobacter sp. Cmf 22.2]
MRIGYYAHHHGSGHCRQADKLAALLPSELRQQMTVFTSLPVDSYRFDALTATQIVRLSAEDERPDDVLSGRAGKYWQPSSLHYSPVGNENIQERSWQLLDAIYQRQVDLMIVDVSVEVAMLCRTASVPYLYVRLAGERDDMPHLNAFAGALGLLAPYPKMLEAAATPGWVRQKTLYLDFLPNKAQSLPSFDEFIDKLVTLSENDTTKKQLCSHSSADEAVYEHDKTNPQTNAKTSVKTNIVTVIKGYGGHESIDAKLPELRQLLPDAIIVSLGPINDEIRHCVDIAAHVDDVTPFIAYSDLLLMACGLNGIAQAYDYATPLVVLPDERPHREQEVMAEALIEQGRALSWAQFIAKASSMDPQNLLYSLSINNKSIDHEQTALTGHQANLVAQNFMNSIANYVSVKAWFAEWLLPQLDLKPKK